MLCGQLDHLLRLGERSDVTVQVVPRGVPNNPVLGEGLITLDFGASAPRIAFKGSHAPATYYDHEEDPTPMFRAMERLRELAASPEESAELLSEKMRGWHRWATTPAG
ncbi:Scr1 family TA system antitoxin-like transcriptional regulator [Saccharopolyspora sp. NPDC047091]|uniref:Scr1 family TA system antitoxin-like transcriptional regulator n=1 Tax=Saccharopolyspora sp. NPDC047091 TaxID=3155924 RepID=UPI00340BF3AA